MVHNVNVTALFAAVSGPCLVMTLDMIVVAVNQAYLDLCGRRREDVLGRHVSAPFPQDRTDPGDRCALRHLEASLGRTRATGEAITPQKYATAPSGGARQDRHGSTIGPSVLGPSGAVMLFVHHTQDVTELDQRPPHAGSPTLGPGTRKKATEARLCARSTQLRQLNEQVREAQTHAKHLLDRQRQFAADASHELRTPLAALRVQTEAAQLHPEDIDLPELLNHVTNDLDRLENIVDDLHTLATIESDLDRTREEMDLTALVETAATRWTGRHDVRLTVEPAVTVEAAPWQLARLLANLLDNARRHATRRLRVDLRRTDGHAELAVADDGKGISPADRERVFQRFVRLDTARSRDRGGTGLGLAIAREIARAHHGSLHVEGAVGGGACFVLRLPLVRRAGTTAPSTGSSS
ncbi:Signal transduction histidine kinase [Streptosporangium subroseum]|uniref:histidine kinase n=1 Tax=Streptosporangium subroseum TaxID=106412 RepID=A0A239EHE4_9ACTN|nr:PAS domain-containing sensor histidine kinase [Streptosporangium subroseum]SNS43698.1 Signal transduction histidine kinase [Streptosporangium subroseum]